MINNVSIPFSPARRVSLVLIYGAMSLGLALIISEFMFRQRMVGNIIQILHPADRSMTEIAALCLILVFCVFSICMLYDMLRLLFICSRIEAAQCRLEVSPEVLRYSTPELTRGWHLEYRTGQLVLLYDKIDSITSLEVWSRRHWLPERSIIIHYKTGETVSIDALFFRGNLSDIRDGIHDAVFPSHEAVSITTDAIRVLDENGNFIPPS